MPPAPERATSIVLGAYDLTSDYVRRELEVLTSFGVGGISVRSRTPGAPGTTAVLAEQGDLLDVHVGIGLGYEVFRSSAFRLAVFGMLTHGLFSLDGDSELNSRYTGGLQLDTVVTPSAERQAETRNWFGISARLGYTSCSGSLAGEFSSQPMSVDAILLQVGASVFVDPRGR